jgi:hypothetical protein
MKSPLKIAAWLSLFTVAIIGAFLLGIYKFQNYRAHKIDFILWDRSHENAAKLSEAELAQYLEACGADVVNSGGELRISYNSTFVRRSWTTILNRKAEQ